MKIMVFLHGTAIMHKNARGRTREERIRQVLDGDESLHDFESYVPVGNVVQRLQAWKGQGAEIVYLSSHKNAAEVEKDKLVLPMVFLMVMFTFARVVNHTTRSQKVSCLIS